MKAILISSLVLYAASLFLPAAEWAKSNPEDRIMYGYHALLIGWAGLAANVYCWFANPLWFFGTVLAFVRKPKSSLVLGLFAFVLAASTFVMVGKDLPGDEGGVTHTSVRRLLPGFYLWLASMALLVLAFFTSLRAAAAGRAAVAG